MFRLIKELQKVGCHKWLVMFRINYPGPPIGTLSDYEYKDNFKAILQQQEGFQTGDVPLIMEVQADSFAFAYAGRKYSKEQFLGAFKDIWLKVDHAFHRELAQSCFKFRTLSMEIL